MVGRLICEWVHLKQIHVVDGYYSCKHKGLLVGYVDNKETSSCSIIVFNSHLIRVESQSWHAMQKCDKEQKVGQGCNINYKINDQQCQIEADICWSCEIAIKCYWIIAAATQEINQCAAEIYQKRSCVWVG